MPVRGQRVNREAQAASAYDAMKKHVWDMTGTPIAFKTKPDGVVYAGKFKRSMAAAPFVPGWAKTDTTRIEAMTELRETLMLIEMHRVLHQWMSRDENADAAQAIRGAQEGPRGTLNRWAGKAKAAVGVATAAGAEPSDLERALYAPTQAKDLMQLQWARALYDAVQDAQERVRGLHQPTRLIFRQTKSRMDEGLAKVVADSSSLGFRPTNTDGNELSSGLSGIRDAVREWADSYNNGGADTREFLCSEQAFLSLLREYADLMKRSHNFQQAGGAGAGRDGDDYDDDVDASLGGDAGAAGGPPTFG